jgi:hypothetical protein
MKAQTRSQKKPVNSAVCHTSVLHPVLESPSQFETFRISSNLSSGTEEDVDGSERGNAQ